MKNVIITGAAGFIGRFVIKELHQMGCNLFALDRISVSDFDGVRSIVTDIDDDNMVSETVSAVGDNQIDCIIHLAAEIRMNETASLISSNCMGTLNVIELAKKLRVKKLIYLSSTPVIGRPKIVPFDESHPVSPESIYHSTKYIGEQMVNLAMNQGIDAVILRICSPVGLRKKQVAYLGYLLNAFQSNQTVNVFGKGSRIQNYIDVRDVADAIVKSLSKGHGLYLIPGGSSVSNLELANICKKITGSDSEIVIGEQADPEDDVKWIPDGSKALKEMGYSPKYTIEDTINWIVGKEL